MPKTPRLRLAGVAVAFGLLATACGGGGAVVDEAATTAALESATNNSFELELTGDITTSEMIDVATGDITTIPDLIDGDKAVLVWYWAPH